MAGYKNRVRRFRFYLSIQSTLSAIMNWYTSSSSSSILILNNVLHKIYIYIVICDGLFHHHTFDFFVTHLTTKTHHISLPYSELGQNEIHPLNGDAIRRPDGQLVLFAYFVSTLLNTLHKQIVGRLLKMHGMMMQAECPKVNQMIRINNMLTILEVFIICLLIFLWNVVLYYYLFIIIIIQSVIWYCSTMTIRHSFVQTSLSKDSHDKLGEISPEIDWSCGRACLCPKGETFSQWTSTGLWRSNTLSAAKILQSFWFASGISGPTSICEVRQPLSVRRPLQWDFFRFGEGGLASKEAILKSGGTERRLPLEALDAPPRKSSARNSRPESWWMSGGASATLSVRRASRSRIDRFSWSIASGSGTGRESVRLSFVVRLPSSCLLSSGHGPYVGPE